MNNVEQADSDQHLECAGQNMLQWSMQNKNIKSIQVFTIFFKLDYSISSKMVQFLKVRNCDIIGYHKRSKFRKWIQFLVKNDSFIKLDSLGKNMESLILRKRNGIIWIIKGSKIALAVWNKKIVNKRKNGIMKGKNKHKNSAQWAAMIILTTDNSWASYLFMFKLKTSVVVGVSILE